VVVCAERLVHVRLLARRDRPSKRLDVAVLHQFVERGERGVVEHRLFDLELVCVLDSVAELGELSVTLARDAPLIRSRLRTRS
jgi:hypothetical protein